MKALAVALIAASSSLAWGQSSLTMYGIIDQGVSRGNGGSAANEGANGTSKAWLLRQSRSSRLGFRGNEDLGGGLSAQFQIEHRFTPDTGVANSTFWAGRSWVQLTSRSAGSIQMGRNYMPAFWPARWSDPFYIAGVGQLGAAMFADFTTASSGTRNPNTIAYKTPSLGGFSLLGAVGLGEGGPGRDQGMNVEYFGGPAYGAIGYEKIAKGTAALNNNSLVNAALHYNFGFIKPMLYVARSKTGGGRLSNEYVSLAATAPLGSGSLKMAVGRLDPAGANNTQTKLGLGYDYYLSKRTWLYADSGFGREDAKSSNRAYALGVRHHF